MKELIKGIMSGEVEMEVKVGEVEDSMSEDAKRIFLEVFIDTEKYPAFSKKHTKKIAIFGIGLWIFKSRTKEEFLKIAFDNKVTMITPSLVVDKDDVIFYLEDLSKVSNEKSVGIVEVALSSGMRNEFLYADEDKKFVEYFYNWYRQYVFNLVREKYGLEPLFKATQSF